MTLKDLRAEARKREMIADAQLSKLDDKLRKVKRAASALWDAENEQLKKQKIAWNMCAKSASRARQVSDEYT